MLQQLAMTRRVFACRRQAELPQAVGARDEADAILAVEDEARPRRSFPRRGRAPEASCSLAPAARQLLQQHSTADE